MHIKMKHKILMGISLILLILFLGFIVGPSYDSARSFTKHQKTGVLSIRNTRALYYPGNDTIVIFNEPGTWRYRVSYEHELCHRIQFYENRNKSGTYNNFLNEMECNIKGYLFSLNKEDND